MSPAKPAIEEKFSREISKAFRAKRIVSLLYFGTRAFGLNVSENSDYDFMLVLDKYIATDASKLRRIVQRKPFKNIDINLNLAYLSDLKIRGKKDFQLRSLSVTFYKYLEYAKLLAGKNIFQEDPIKLTKRDVIRTEGFKVQEYYGRCDKLYFQKITDQKLYLHLMKYTKDIIWLLLVRQGLTGIKDLTRVPYEEMLGLAVKKGLMTPKSARDFRQLLGSSYSRINQSKLERIRRQLYLKYLQLFKSSN